MWYITRRCFIIARWRSTVADHETVRLADLPDWLQQAIRDSQRPDKPLALPETHDYDDALSDSEAGRPRAWQPPPGQAWAVSDEWISFANGRYLIPRRFGFLMYVGRGDRSITGAAVVEVDVQPSGQLRCERLDLVAAPDEGIDGDLLRRIPLRRVMRVWAIRIARPLGGKTFGEQEREAVDRGEEITEEDFQLYAEKRAFEAALAGSSAQRRTGAFPPTTENLQQVADAYRDAMAQGSRNPREYVAQALYISESTASRRIRAARDHDPPLLGAALGKRPGEAPLPPTEEP
jgi:hypothetical protein